MHLGAGEIAQLVKCLPCKYEGLSSILRTLIKKSKKPGMVASAYSAKVRETETGGFLGLAGQPA